MNYTDVLFITITIIAIIIGYKKGFIAATINLFSLVAGIFFGIIFQPQLSLLLRKFFSAWELYIPAIAFIIPSVMFFVIYCLLLGYIKRAVSLNTHKSRLNKYTGIIPAFVFVYSVTYLICFQSPLLNTFPETAHNDMKNSRALNLFWSFNKNNVIDIRNYENVAHAGKTEAPKTSSLPFSTADFSERPDLEATMLDIINKERALNNLPPLAADPELRKVAVGHSADMLIRGYFSHDTPDGVNAFTRMKSAGIKYTFAGENLAVSQNLYKAHTLLMLSPGHRANILSPSFGRIGIGVLDAGGYGLMISQEFRD